MATSEHISNLITAYKAMPNSERRNKVVSHLKDAEAHAKLMEIEDPRMKTAEEERSLFASNPETPAKLSEMECICRPGMRNRYCMAQEHVA